MEKIVWQGLLYDFYGELLTQHQRRVYEDVVFNDLSLSEIAKEQGVTRQGVHDLVRRCDRILEGYEEKLHLVKKFQETRRLANEIQKLLEEYQETKDHILLRKAKEMAEKIVDI
ncbi:MAG: YlxM family DNA-binding protein [Hungatella sp.]|nr:YlxM family DNA-binding protein [Hungatella sp.]MCI9500819.1 YlxM family DNA-binding protein [Hungatella sp.]